MNSATQGCIGYVCITVTKIPERTTSRKERFILAHCCRGLHPWLVGPHALGQNIMAVGMCGGRISSSHSIQETEVETGRDKNKIPVPNDLRLQLGPLPKVSRTSQNSTTNWGPRL
jgi:hypothetical protein